MFLQIVLRGISGVGKTTLRKMLASAFISKGYKVIVESKDEIRKEVARTSGMPYVYSEQQEKLTSWLYQSRVHALLHPFEKKGPFSNAVLICDNTHVNMKQLQESEFCTLFDPKDNKPKRYQRVLIEIGSFDSFSSKSYAFPKIVARQRVQWVDSSVPLHNWCQTHYIPQFWLNDHTAIEDGISDIVESLLEIKEKSIE